MVKFAAVALTVLFLGAAGVLSPLPCTSCTVKIPLTLPPHPNAGVVKDDCVGQEDGTWKCMIAKRTTETRHMSAGELTAIWTAWEQCEGTKCID